MFPEDEEEGVELPSNIDFSDPKSTSTPNLYWTKNRYTQKVINVLFGKGITNFIPVQAKSFIPVLAGYDVIGKSQSGTGKNLAFGIPAMTRLSGLAEDKGNYEA